MNGVKLDNSKRVHFQNLDMLRFFAAYLIVLLHCYFGWKAFFGVPDIVRNEVSQPLIERMEIVLHNFSFGVDIFFLISGFLITYLLLVEQKKTGKIDVVRFYIRRAFRIWPLYFLLVLTAPLLTYFFLEQSPGYFYQFIFAGNFDVIQQGPKSVATDHLWSICIEEHFYLFCPLLIAFIPAKKLPQALMGVILITVLFRAYTSMGTEEYGMVIYMHTLSRIDVLAIGSLLGYLCYHKRLNFDHSLGVRCCVYTIFLLTFIFTDYAECGTFFTTAVKKYTFVLLAAYWAGNFLFNERSVLKNSMPEILNRFGKASYGIYMFNPVVIFLVLKLFAAYGWQNYLLFLGIVHVALFVVTFLSYRLLEMPFLALKEKYAVIRSGGKIRALENESEEEIEGGVTPIPAVGKTIEKDRSG